MHRMPDNTLRPIYNASRSLTAAEKNYSQIEKEALAIIFGIQKFHKYIFGRQFTIHTDHKPLLAIFGSKSGIPVNSANRLQRWGTILLGYDFKIQYIKTDSFGYADMLSRLISQHPKDDEEYIMQIINEAIQPFPVSYYQLKNETQKDELLQNVMINIQNNWKNTNCSNELEF